MTPDGSSVRNLDYTDALKIGSAVMLLLICLLILRFSFNMCIDRTCLGRRNGTRRNRLEGIGEVTREAGSARQATGVELTEAALSIEKIDQILKPRNIDEKDLIAWKEDLEDSGEPHILCSICIHALREGEKVYELPCTHLFHSNCLLQWLSRDDDRPVSSKGCPTCRQLLIP